MKVPRRDVRPTTDMVREALFAILGESVIDARFLDLFGGSGAVGIEAWSRGAGSVCWIEEDGSTVKILTDNVKQLCDNRTRILKGDALRQLKRGAGGEAPFDIIFADPPYRETTDYGRQAADDKGLIEELLDAVAEGGVLKEGGVFIMEMGKKSKVTEAEGWRLSDERKYGRTKLCFFRRNEQ